LKEIVILAEASLARKRVQHDSIEDALLIGSRRRMSTRSDQGRGYRGNRNARKCGLTVATLVELVGTKFSRWPTLAHHVRTEAIMGTSLRIQKKTPTAAAALSLGGTAVAPT